MKRALTILLALLLIAVVYLLIIDWFVPRTAVIGMPFKWKRLPLRESKAVVHNYLGEPFVTDSILHTESWKSGTGNKTYRLDILYYADTIVAGYSIHYHFEKFGLSCDYLVDSASIR
jgi:hypothetical protein